MRDIKFRGKRIDNGEWVVGDYSRYSEEKSIIMVDLLEEEDYWVSNDTVGQFTGLKDRNGAEIYEGDIVKCFNDGLSEITFRTGCFGLLTHTEKGTDYYTFDEVYGVCEVIGNIYENPELIVKENS